MVQDVEVLVWHHAAQSHKGGLSGVLSVLLSDYRRRPGQDQLVRLLPRSLGEKGFQALREALREHPRCNVWFCDRGDYIEIRSRLRNHLLRGLQRIQVMADRAPDAVVEDLLGHDIGI